MIKDNNILEEIDNLLKYKDDVVFYKKIKISDDRYLYAYRDPKCTYEQETGYVCITVKNFTTLDTK